MKKKIGLNKEGLKDLEAGDKVLVHNCHYVSEAVVERVTDLYIVVDGNKYRKKDGYIAGTITKYDAVYIRPYDKEAAQWHDKMQMCYSLSSLDWRQIPYEEVKELYNKYVKSKEVWDF